MVGAIGSGTVWIGLLACREPVGVRPDPPTSPPTGSDTGPTGSDTGPTGSDTGPTDSGSSTGSTEDCVAVGIETTLDPTGLAAGATLALGDWADTPSVPLLPTTTTDGSGGALLFSDSPEAVAAPGLLYADRLDGPGRLYLYHATDRAEALRYAVVLSGLGTDTTVDVTAAAVAGPWGDYLYVGRMGALRYEQARAAPPTPTSVEVPAAGAVELDPALAPEVRQTWLMHGIWDLVPSDPVQVSFVAVEPGDDPVAALPTLPVAPRDVHDRGTFTPTERTIAGCVDPAAGTLRIRLANGEPADPWATGADALTGAAEELVGNYGVHYTIDLTLQSTDGRSVAALLAPRGGPITGAAWVDDQVLDLPSDADLLEVGAAAVIGTWDPAVQDRALIRWTPAGASSLPVDLLLVPVGAGTRVGPR